MAVLRTLGSPASSKKPGMPPPTSVTGGGVGASGKSVVEKTETALLPEELKILNKSAAQCFLTTPNIQNAYPSLTTLIGSFGELAVAKRIKVIERIKETRTLLPHLTDSQFFTLWKELKLEWQETRIQDLQFLTEQVADSLSAAAVSGTESTLESIKSASLSMTMTKRGFLGSEACRRAIALVNIYLESDDTARKTPTRSLDNRTMEDMVTGPHGLVKSMSEADSSVFGSVSKFDFLLGGPNAFADQLFNQVGVRASKLTPSEYVRAGECLDYAKLWRISADEIITEAAFRVRELGGLTDDIWEAIGSLQGMKNLMKKLGPLSAFTKQDLVLEIARGQFPNLSDTMLRDFASHFEKGAQAWTGKLRGGPIFR